MKGLAKGMATVMRHLLKPAVTEGYPWEPKVLPERSRTSFALPLDENGVPYCKSCMLCAKSCPDDAIKIVSEKREDGPGRVLKRFEIDLGLCMYCGLCVENCPSSGLHHTGDFETATAERGDMTLVLYSAENPATPATATANSASQGSSDNSQPAEGGEVA
ncbi:MAG TPA: NADH-quinone oxidoreductase subunit I [Coriobacteriia bacterium]|nr:NADH-quinone oxidoreductase subunit I [Coriobacteriia bacterium]